MGGQRVAFVEMLAGLRPDVLDRILGCIPVGHLGKPEEIASIVARLASDEAGFATGRTFPQTAACICSENTRGPRSHS